MHDYKKLYVWEKSVSFVTEIYKLTKTFPDTERYGLISQINRSAVSIPSNIAEGTGRNTNGEFRNFLGNACGSICELETQLIIANNLNYLSLKDLNNLLSKLKSIQKMSYKLKSSLAK